MPSFRLTTQNQQKSKNATQSACASKQEQCNSLQASFQISNSANSAFLSAGKPQFGSRCSSGSNGSLVLKKFLG